MVEPGEIRPIKCACGKPFLWASQQEMEVQCDACKRRILLPFAKLVSRNLLLRFVALWRRRQRGEPPGGDV